MPVKSQNLSKTASVRIPGAERFKIGILVSEWNEEVTSSLRDGAEKALLDSGVSSDNIRIENVPGSFELPTGAVMMLESDENLDAVICLGCIIQGETRHFEFISQAVAHGITKVAVDYNTPVIFGVLTCDTLQQALDRSGGSHGNKGTEAAVSCLKMLALEKRLKR